TVGRIRPTSGRLSWEEVSRAALPVARMNRDRHKKRTRVTRRLTGTKLETTEPRSPGQNQGDLVRRPHFAASCCRRSSHSVRRVKSGRVDFPAHPDTLSPGVGEFLVNPSSPPTPGSGSAEDSEQQQVSDRCEHAHHDPDHGEYRARLDQLLPLELAAGGADVPPGLGTEDQRDDRGEQTDPRASRRKDKIAEEIP